MHGVVHRRDAYSGSKGYCPAAGQKVIALPRKRLFSSGMVQKDRAQDGPRRRRKASGRVVTCPEGWMALKRKPRNRALFALCDVGAPCKIEAGLRQVYVGKRCSVSGRSDCMA